MLEMYWFTNPSTLPINQGTKMSAIRNATRSSNVGITMYWKILPLFKWSLFAILYSSAFFVDGFYLVGDNIFYTSSWLRLVSVVRLPFISTSIGSSEVCSMLLI
jgi:hypothetical protein